MEVYLNVIEMGKGIYGAEAASKKYFKTNALNLSKKQAASIAAILPLPQEWSPVKPNRYISSRINLIRNQMDYIDPPSWTKQSK
jgi:monofunctional glycosyltransferase